MILPKIQPFDCTIGVNGSSCVNAFVCRMFRSTHFCSVNFFYNPFGLWRTFWVQKLIVCFLWFYEVFLFNAYESFIEYSSLLLFLHSFTVVVSHRTRMEKLYSLGFTQTLPEWRYLPLQKQSVGRFSFTHTHLDPRGKVERYREVQCPDFPLFGRAAVFRDGWEFSAKQTWEGYSVCCLDRKSHRITFASVFVSLSNVKDKKA